MANERASLTLAMTGASGSVYGLRLLQALLNAGRRVHFVISHSARIVLETETELRLPQDSRDCAAALRAHLQVADGELILPSLDDWFSPIASGSNAPGAMVVCPCSGGMLSAVANGASNNLIERAADVMLKERRQLLLVPRETPLSSIHLENMLKLSRMGAVIMPASPGFYHRPTGIDDLVDFMVGRILDHLGVDTEFAPRWG